jgi:hypothetical protein
MMADSHFMTTSNQLVTKQELENVPNVQRLLRSERGDRFLGRWKTLPYPGVEPVWRMVSSQARIR